MQEHPKKPPVQPEELPDPHRKPILDPIIAADVLPHQGRGSIPSDTQGSYTGTPEDDWHPVQDADDL